VLCAQDLRVKQIFFTKFLSLENAFLCKFLAQNKNGTLKEKLANVNHPKDLVAKKTNEKE